MPKKKYYVLGLISMLSIVRTEISDTQYAFMPELFYLDNFDHCMLKGEDGVFCTFTFQLAPLPNVNSTVWNIIEDVISNPQNYRHDRLRHGICLSESCAPEYMEDITFKEMITKCYNKKYTSLGIKGRITSLTCQTNNFNYPIDVYDSAVGLFVIIYVVFVIFASVYERYVQPNFLMCYKSKAGEHAQNVIAAFSIPQNWYRLISTSTNPDHRKIKGIQGIRFFSMICIIMCHSVSGFLGGPISNPQYTENSTKHVLNMFFSNGWYIVQGFFIISGFLLAYHFFERLEEKRKIESKFFIWAVLLRYIRLVIPMAFMAALHSTWLVHAGQGPYWDMIVGEEYRNCRKNWWTNILFINNHVDTDNMCMHHTWYIATDMQLFIFSTFLLMLIWKYPSKLKYIFAGALFTGFLIPGVLAYINHYDIVLRHYPENIYKIDIVKLPQWGAVYISPYSNIFAYTAGMLTGYFFVIYRKKDIVIKTIHIILWWVLTFGTIIPVMLVAVIFYNPSFIVTPINSAIYWSSGKAIFTFGACIFLFGLTQKIGWFARWFCEFQPIQVLGRLTYSAYIVHYGLIRMQMGFRRFPSYANGNLFLPAVMGDIVCGYLGGTVLCLLVEMPITALQKLLRITTDPQTISSQKPVETIDVKCENYTDDT